MSRRRILLYSPDVIGHPRVYCRVIADALQAEECDLVLAMGFSGEAELKDSPDLHPLTRRDRVQIIDNRTRSATRNPHLQAAELVALQGDLRIDTTLFIEADKSEDVFRRITAGEAPRLRGRNLGIFAKTAEWYPGEDSFTGEPRRIVAPTIRTTLGNIKRALFDRQRTARHFYEEIILRHAVLDEIITKDERLSEWHGPPVYWMPEISRPVEADEVAASNDDQAAADTLQQFLNANRSREPVLYFGDAAFYKGYDLFLQFVNRSPQTAALHPGRTYDPQQAAWFADDVEVLRDRLRGEGRLFETNEYVHSQRVKERFFGSIRLYITTHRLTLSSSTVIQAWELGKPVLVPDRGLLAHRVRESGAGEVYRYGDLDDLRRKAEALWQSDLTRFEQPARRMWERFSDEAIRRFFVRRLLGTGESVR